MNYEIKIKTFNHFKTLIILIIFFVSMFALITPLTTTTNQGVIPQVQSFSNSNFSLAPGKMPKPTSSSNLLQSSLDQALYNWVNSSSPLNPNLYRFTNNNDPVVTIFAPPGTNLQSINQNVKTSSFVDLGANGFIIFGSVSSSQNLVNLVETNSFIKVSSDPYNNYLDSLYLDSSNQPKSASPTDLVTQYQMFTKQTNQAGYNGSGVTIAMVDGGTDFGNSDLSNATALDANGLPMSFDTEGWSLVATPLTVGTDIPITTNKSILLFSQVPQATLDKLQINDPGNITPGEQPVLDLSRGWEYWHNQANFMSPQNWKINSTWIGQPGQAPPKFGVGVEYWNDLYTDHVYYGYFYALLIDLNHDGKYDSVVIDMATSAWASYLKFIADGGHESPLSQIQPDFNFANDKIVSWFNNTNRKNLGWTPATGDNYTFAIDWNNDGVNDWSYGSLANAYNRWDFLPVNQSKYGKIINGVDPNGSGFVAYYPFGYGFSEHGTWTASVAVSRGMIPYQVFSNNTNSWDYPYGNSTVEKLPGAATGANLMSITFGASPQDELIAWFWAAGFDLTSNESANTADITGAQWKWSGQVRANITSNSWGIGGIYWGGLWGTDWLSDLLSMPNFGGSQTYVRKMTDLWSGDVMSGPNSASSAGDINYGNSFTPFTSQNTTLYIGANNPFVALGVNISTPASSSLSFLAYYYNGSTWRFLTVNQSIDFTVKGLNWLNFTLPLDWKLTAFKTNGQQLYWIKIIAVASNLQISNLLVEFPNPYYGYPGMLMVVAAGNDNYYQSTASPFGTLTLKVGASSSSNAYANIYGPYWNQTSDQMAFFSSAGPKSSGAPGVDIVAPGYFVYSGTPLYRSIISNNRGPGVISNYGGDGTKAYVIWAGTSSSTPAIAGVAAIAYQAYMKAHPGVSVNPSVIKQIIKSTATNLQYPGNIQGAGFVNASAIVDYIMNTTNSNYFVLGSNLTYEDQLSISPWINLIGTFYYYYAYSARDPYADVVDFPSTNQALLSQPHADDDLSTNTIPQGSTVSTQITVQDNSSQVTVTPVNASYTTIQQFFPVTTSDQIKGPYGDYLINLSLANMAVWNANYLQITVSDLVGINNVSLDIWHDTNNNHNIDMPDLSNPQTNGVGELSKVQYESTLNNQSYAVLQVGNPGQYNNSYFKPFLILRGDPKMYNTHDPHWASSKSLYVYVSIKAFYLYNPWSAISINPLKTVNNVSYFNVSINTVSMTPGFNFGFLKFTNQAGHSEFMPLSVKVAYDKSQIQLANTATSTPALIGSYTIPHFGSTYQVGFTGGSMIWVPFTVDESKTTTNDVLAIRVTQTSSGSANIGFVLHYDETPQTFDANWFPIYVSSTNTGQYNGNNVNWQYIPWGSTGFEQNALISRFGYIRIQYTPYNHIVDYKIGLFTTQADGPVTVKLEMYWLSNMPIVYSSVNSNYLVPQFGYCQNSYSSVCVSNTNVVVGPNSTLDVATHCQNCDPNLPAPTVLFGKQQAITELSSGTFSSGNYDPSYSVDYWVKRYFHQGDLVEFSLTPTNPSAAVEVWLFSPLTLSNLNTSAIASVPMSDLGVLLSSDGLFRGYGAFLAPSTGEYWFGIDNYQNSNTNLAYDTNWVFYSKESIGSLYDFQSSSVSIDTNDSSIGLGINAEATYNYQTGMYDNVSDIVVGAATPTGLSNEFYSLDVAIDNYIAPFVILGPNSNALNNTVVSRSKNQITFDWDLQDLNGNSATSVIFIVGPFSNDIYSGTTSATSATWDFSNPQLYPNGWWTIYIFGDDSGDARNRINGTNYGGLGFPSFFRIFIDNASGVVTTTQTITNPGSSELLSPFGFSLIGAVVGAGGMGVGVFGYFRRDDLKLKYNDVKGKVNNEISKRRRPKE